jgi:hypothetical protein
MTTEQEMLLLRAVLSGTLAALVSLLDECVIGVNLPIWVCALIGSALVLGCSLIIFMINKRLNGKRNPA